MDLWNGYVSLENLALIPREIFLSNGLSLSLSTGRVAKAGARIPWSLANLVDTRSGISLALEGVLLECRLLTQTYRSPDSADKLAGLLADEIKLLASSTTGNSQNQTSWWSSLLEGLLAPLLQKISVTIENIKIKIILPLDSLTHSSDFSESVGSYVFEVYIPSIDIAQTSVDKKFRRDKAAGNILFTKDLSIRGLTVSSYVLSADGEKTEKTDKNGRNDEVKEGRDVLVCPCYLQLHAWAVDVTRSSSLSSSFSSSFSERMIGIRAESSNLETIIQERQLAPLILSLNQIQHSMKLYSLSVEVSKFWIAARLSVQSYFLLNSTSQATSTFSLIDSVISSSFIRLKGSFNRLSAKLKWRVSVLAVIKYNKLLKGLINIQKTYAKDSTLLINRYISLYFVSLVDKLEKNGTRVKHLFPSVTFQQNSIVEEEVNICNTLLTSQDLLQSRAKVHLYLERYVNNSNQILFRLLSASISQLDSSNKISTEEKFKSSISLWQRLFGIVKSSSIPISSRSSSISEEELAKYISSNLNSSISQSSASSSTSTNPISMSFELLLDIERVSVSLVKLMDSSKVNKKQSGQPNKTSHFIPMPLITLVIRGFNLSTYNTLIELRILSFQLLDKQSKEIVSCGNIEDRDNRNKENDKYGEVAIFISYNRLPSQKQKNIKVEEKHEKEIKNDAEYFIDEEDEGLYKSVWDFMFGSSQKQNSEKKKLKHFNETKDEFQNFNNHSQSFSFVHIVLEIKMMDLTFFWDTHFLSFVSSFSNSVNKIISACQENNKFLLKNSTNTDNINSLSNFYNSSQISERDNKEWNIQKDFPNLSLDLFVRGIVIRIPFDLKGNYVSSRGTKEFLISFHKITFSCGDFLINYLNSHLQSRQSKKENENETSVHSLFSSELKKFVDSFISAKLDASFNLNNSPLFNGIGGRQKQNFEKNSKKIISNNSDSVWGEEDLNLKKISFKLARNKGFMFVFAVPHISLSLTQSDNKNNNKIVSSLTEPAWSLSGSVLFPQNKNSAVEIHLVLCRLSLALTFEDLNDVVNIIQTISSSFPHFAGVGGVSARGGDKRTESVLRKNTEKSLKLPQLLITTSQNDFEIRFISSSPLAHHKEVRQILNDFMLSVKQYDVTFRGSAKSVFILQKISIRRLISLGFNHRRVEEILTVLFSFSILDSAGQNLFINELVDFLLHRSLPSSNSISNSGSFLPLSTSFSTSSSLFLPLFCFSFSRTQFRFDTSSGIYNFGFSTEEIVLSDNKGLPLLYISNSPLVSNSEESHDSMYDVILSEYQYLRRYSPVYNYPLVSDLSYDQLKPFSSNSFSEKSFDSSSSSLHSSVLKKIWKINKFGLIKTQRDLFSSKSLKEKAISVYYLYREKSGVQNDENDKNLKRSAHVSVEFNSFEICLVSPSQLSSLNNLIKYIHTLLKSFSNNSNNSANSNISSPSSSFHSTPLTSAFSKTSDLKRKTSFTKNIKNSSDHHFQTHFKNTPRSATISSLPSATSLSSNTNSNSDSLFLDLSFKVLNVNLGDDLKLLAKLSISNTSFGLIVNKGDWMCPSIGLEIKSSALYDLSPFGIIHRKILWSCPSFEAPFFLIESLNGIDFALRSQGLRYLLLYRFLMELIELLTQKLFAPFLVQSTSSDVEKNKNSTDKSSSPSRTSLNESRHSDKEMDLKSVDSSDSEDLGIDVDISKSKTKTKKSPVAH